MYYRRSRASSRGSVFDLLNTPTNCTLSVSAPGSRRGSKPSISIEQEPDPESYGKPNFENFGNARAFCFGSLSQLTL